MSWRAIQYVILVLVVIVIAEGVLIGQIVQGHQRREIHDLRHEIEGICQDTKQIGTAILKANDKAPLTVVVRCPPR